MTIYLNGCSHMHADKCPPSTKASFGYIVASSILGIGNYTAILYTYWLRKKYDAHRNSISDSYKDIFFDKMEPDKNYVLNHSQCGKSNDKIFYETITTLYESIKLNKRIDLYIIQWSGPNRRLHTLPSDETKRTESVEINPHDFSELGIKIEPFASNQTLHYMLILQDLFDKYNIEYVFVPYMELDSNSLKMSNIKSMLNSSKLTCDVEVGHRNEIRKKGYSIDYPGHPNQIGHYYLASKILDVLNIGNNLVGFFEFYNSIISDFNLNNFVTYHDSITNMKKYYNELGDGEDNLLKRIFKKTV